ncbi:MAG: hypothetical protein A2X86_19440 [Bdellovibrionales bacterium GWA2_49_15]|nr:MAG: hypothetical protein A2X86_19440 [Bdellovibrionales bacterium GWA2_49_15]HAZ14404.1 hypothetical protein [Bdellovibrionales bacterium]
MKKTIFLLGIAVFLGIFTYHFEELGGIKKVEGEKNARALFDQTQLGELIGLRLPRATVKKVNGQFRVMETDQLVDAGKLQEVFDILGYLQVRRILSSEELKLVSRKEFFPTEEERFAFVFEKGEVPVLIGKKVDHEQSFYLEVKTPGGVKTVLAYDSSPQVQPVSEETYRLNPFKYNRILSIVHLQPSFFHDTFLFREWKRKAGVDNIAKVEFQNVRNIPFSIDLKNKSTVPVAPAGIRYLNKSFQDYAASLYNMQAGVLWAPQDLGTLKEKVATLSISTTTGDKFMLELFKKAQSAKKQVRIGQFVKMAHEKMIFEISPNTSKLLFASSQDFLEKRIYQNMGAAGLTLDGDKEEPFAILFKHGESASLTIQKGDDFEVKPTNPGASVKPLNSSFSQLFSFLFTPGERVSVMDKDDFKMISKAFMTITYQDHPIHLIYEEREIFVLNPTSGIKINYYVGNEIPIAMEADDYFDTRIGKFK